MLFYNFINKVYYSCWESNPDIKAWMQSRNYTMTNQVEEYYMTRVLTLTRNIGYKSIVWQDVWDNNVPV
jgi:hexosaminidase